MASLLTVALVAAGLAAWAVWAVRRLLRRKGGCACCTKDCPYRK